MFTLRFSVDFLWIMGSEPTVTCRPCLEQQACWSPSRGRWEVCEVMQTALWRVFPSTQRSVRSDVVLPSGHGLQCSVRLRSGLEVARRVLWLFLEGGCVPVKRQEGLACWTPPRTRTASGCWPWESRLRLRAQSRRVKARWAVSGRALAALCASEKELRSRALLLCAD